MTGTPVVAAWIGEGAFWVLLALGYWGRSLGSTTAWVFLGLWLAGLIGGPYLPYGDVLFAPYVGMLDVVLALVVFKGDVRLM